MDSPSKMAATEALRFGKNLIGASLVFLQSPSSYAFTNRKPIVPGRILNYTLPMGLCFSDTVL